MTMRGACCAGTTANSARDRTANFATDILCHRTWGRRSWQAPLPDGRGSDWSRDRSIRAVTVSTYMVEFCNFLAEYFRGHRPRPMLARLPLHSEIGANFRGNSPGVSPRLSADSALSAVDFPSSSSAFSPRLRVSASNSHPVWFRLRRVRERFLLHHRNSERERSAAGAVQQAIDLRAILLHRADPEAGDGEQFRRRGGAPSRHGFQRLVAEDAEGGNSAPFRFRQAPLAQLLFDARIGRYSRPV